MASELEFVPFKDFVESLPARTTAKSGDKTVVSNSTDGPGSETNDVLAQKVLDGKYYASAISRLNGGVVLEQGTYSAITGAKTYNSKRLRFSEPLIPPFMVTTKTGFKIVSAQILNNAFVCTDTAVVNGNSYQVEADDGKLYCIIFSKTDDTDISTEDDVIDTFVYDGISKISKKNNGVIERLNGGITLEQGGYSSGLKTVSSTRLRFSAPLIPPFKITTNSGYQIRAYHKVDNYGNFVESQLVASGKLNIRVNDGCKYLILFANADHTQNIDVNENVISEFNYASIDQFINAEAVGYNSDDNSLNTRIDPSTGVESVRAGWIATGFLKVSSSKNYVAYSKDKKMIRNYVFYYDQNKNFAKSESVAVDPRTIGGLVNSINIYGWTGYVRFYVDQASDGRYPSYVDSFCFEEVLYDVSPLVINRQLGNEPEERHLISRTETYSEFIANHFDCFSELEKIDLGLSWYFPNKTQMNFYGYEYKPSKGYKKTILLTANTHGGERESSYALAAAVYMILSKFSFDEKIKYIRDNCRLLIVPSCNPFGYNEDVAHYQEAGWNWRKYQGNSQGTNNNRCWDFGWANADKNYSVTDYVGDDTMKSEDNNVYEGIIKPNIGMIDAWFDLHQGTDYDDRYWLSSYVSQYANPLYSDLSQWLKNLCATKRELGTYGSFTTEYGGKAAMFGTNALGIPAFTLENNSLPTSEEVTFVNYTSKSVTNFCEYILNMVYAVAISKYNPNSTLSSSEYFRSRRLTCPASKMFGDMFTDSSAKIIERFDGVYERSASIFKSVVTGLGEVYVIDNGNEPTKDLVLVGGDKFDINTVNIYATALATDYRTTNSSSAQTLALGSKNIYALLRFAEMAADNSNSDKFVQEVLNKYKIHIIPLINKSAFDNKTSDSVLETNAQALVDYCQNLSDVRVIYFNEVDVADSVFSVKTTSTNALDALSLQVLADAGIVVNKDGSVIADVDAINPGNTFGVNFKSRVVQSGVDYSTDQISLLVGAVVNIACVD